MGSEGGGSSEGSNKSQNYEPTAPASPAAPAALASAPAAIMFDYVGVAVVVVVVVSCGWLAGRAWRAKRRLVKWIGAPLAGLVALVGTAVLVAALVGYWKLNRRYDNPVSTISVVMTPERIERGARFGEMCAGCHAADEEPPMEGNDFLADEDAPPIGTFYAPNLTPTHLSSWTDGEIIRAIREGIHKDGRSLLIMPAKAFRNLSDDDVASIVAYLRTQPPVEPDTPRPRLNLLGALMVNLAPIFEAQEPITQPILAPPAGATPEYGEYLVSYSCTMCHGEDLGGNVDFKAPSLIAVATTWSDEDFLEFFETGVRPNGVAVDGDQMPWKELRGFLLDDDFRAVYSHLQQRFPRPER